MAELRLARLARADLPAVVAIHERAFPDSAITAFGAEAIRRYYLWLLEGPHDAALVGAWQGARLAGFCAAGIFRGAMNGFLRANRRYLALHVATHPRLLASPLIRDRVKAALRITVRFSRVRHRENPSTTGVPFGVLSIATDPAIRAGAGRALMHDAEVRARAAGHDLMVLTVHPDNTHAVGFYEQLGWQRKLEGGTWNGRMTRAIVKDSGP